MKGSPPSIRIRSTINACEISNVEFGIVRCRLKLTIEGLDFCRSNPKSFTSRSYYYVHASIRNLSDKLEHPEFVRYGDIQKACMYCKRQTAT
jgi:hypothetical protein